MCQQATRSTFSSEVLVRPSARSVLQQIGQCNLVHFACHGISDPVDPFSSGLVLQDDTSDAPRVEKLTVRQISEANLQRATIAYLSACSTAENLEVQLANEVIHLASGFQVAGFSHVVASMWALQDEICLDMAKGFSERLQDHAGGRPTDREVGLAVHNSVLEIRSKLRKMPLRWAPYIHLGA